MQLTSEQILKRNDYLTSELLGSLPSEVYNTPESEDGIYNVKFIVNGVEVNPVIYNDILQDMEGYILRGAKLMVSEKLSEAMSDARKLVDLVKLASDNICDSFGISTEDL